MVSCPVCQQQLDDFDLMAATAHVNNCLDSTSASQSLSAVSRRVLHPIFTKHTSSPSPSERVKTAVSKKETRDFKRRRSSTLATNFKATANAISTPKSTGAIKKTDFKTTPINFAETTTATGILKDSTQSLASTSFLYSIPSYKISSVGGDESFVNKKPDKGTKQTTSHESLPKSVDNTSNFISSKKSCPWYKRLPNTGFTIDAFSYGSIPDCTAYFLSHFHADHYGGLSSKFNAGPIYCSRVTANLVISQLRVDKSFVNILDMDQSTIVQGVEVSLIDANHCPGAVLFVFTVPDSTPKSAHNNSNSSQIYLHTGDFRALHPYHTLHPLLKSTRFKAIYLDTTYCAESHAFPNQASVLSAIQEFAIQTVKNDRPINEVVGIAAKHGNVDLMRQFLAIGASINASSSSNFGEASFSPHLALSGVRKKGTLICVGTYTIGKERVFIALAKALESKIYVEPAKKKILACLEDEDLNSMLTDNPMAASVHVVKIGRLGKEDLEAKLQSVSQSFSKLIAIRPTGWTHRPQKTDNIDEEFTVKSIKPTKVAPNIYSIPLPYSEHSSYTELKTFVTALDAQQIIPTVNIARHAEMQQVFESWKQNP
ncbi:hypothetical protein HK100_004876 [Physocladia obscura]|uniref:DNA repair metallo-beta-lactamase domain-containing protein n=1 Tax=Physocladia obscura TaxID=109957 RepID=A0AAD5SSB4_9FUNG|nr:hypothetical protein HK100_004876 [Physocladia obscura]